MCKKLTTSEFCIRASKIHNNKYDYSRSHYINYNTELIIICPHHGEFHQIPDYHLRGSGCPQCYGNPLKTTNTFVLDATHIHGDKYDYTNTIYINAKTKVQILCLKCSNMFTITPNKHLSMKRGCKCYSESQGERMISSWLNDANIPHNRQHKFVDCKNIRPLPFDFYIPTHKVCIEYDGEQHFHEANSYSPEAFIQTQHNDSIKTKYCEDHNIELIRIPYWDKSNISEILTTHLI